ncbi:MULTISPECIES: hypothetical protein [Bacillus]|uniref:hypothetical protein n=1 Tax=Bacillus TaxID=1386 RepID=UPI00057E9D1A|nr:MULTISPECIES: hypothetical protein [Bacillus]AIZ59296.1 hypothetical protein QR42_03055 [Bacillus sp. WP8]UXC33090.1 hypothetical protein N4Q31_03070 [Bacillus safensis]
MELETKYKSSVPISIQLLFNNQKLDIMKVLCLMNALSIQNKKQRKVEEILFYYSLVNFDLAKIFHDDIDNIDKFTLSPNQYFRFQTKINEILLIMSHLQFIEVKGKMYNKIGELKVKLISSGEKFYHDNKSEYLNSLFNKYVEMYTKISYSAENAKRIKEGRY